MCAYRGLSTKKGRYSGAMRLWQGDFNLGQGKIIWGLDIWADTSESRRVSDAERKAPAKALREGNIGYTEALKGD